MSILIPDGRVFTHPLPKLAPGEELCGPLRCKPGEWFVCVVEKDKPERCWCTRPRPCEVPNA